MAGGRRRVSLKFGRSVRGKVSVGNNETGDGCRRLAKAASSCSGKRDERGVRALTQGANLPSGPNWLFFWVMGTK